MKQKKVENKKKTKLKLSLCECRKNHSLFDDDEETLPCQLMIQELTCDTWSVS